MLMIISLLIMGWGVKGKHGLQGVNAEFLHQKDNIGVIGSATYLSKTDGEYVKTQYASIQVGPSFALSDSFFYMVRQVFQQPRKLKDDQPNEKYGVALVLAEI
jgi:outer membrane protein X